ncbi:hypothetical protein QBC34DRAFT_83510 [Podospora aff. communis PSN243]|uniref:Uncharacterized protein n=1 Tax=Podospora aff. communis PSN243 TaxID=3040156 RepID=A0AAV9GMY3_9PEZI|nr:hypothetical protein QBC34DRAFT_83510 [Podospora aff. communis PSN243]
MAAANLPPLNLAHYRGQVPNLMPDLKPMTLSFLDFSPELRNRVYELLVVKESTFNRAGFPNSHRPEDGIYDSDSSNDDVNENDEDDSDTDMEDAPISQEEAMDLEEDVKFLTGSTVTPLDKHPDPDLEYDDSLPKGYKACNDPDTDHHQCQRVGGFFSTSIALPFMWTCKQIYEELGSIVLRQAPYIVASPCAYDWLVAMPSQFITNLDLQILTPIRGDGCPDVVGNTERDIAESILGLVASRCPNLEELRLWVEPQRYFSRNRNLVAVARCNRGPWIESPIFWCAYGASVMDPRWNSIDETQFSSHHGDHTAPDSCNAACDFILEQKEYMSWHRELRDLYVNMLWPALKKLQRLRALTVGGVHDWGWLKAVARDLNIEFLIARFVCRPTFDALVHSRVDLQTGRVVRVQNGYIKDSDDEM